jgi:hypothetical protein
VPHFPKPFWRADRKRWMLQLHPGKVVTLGADRDAAFRKYHAMMAESDTVHSPAPAVVSGEEPLVVKILDQFRSGSRKTAIRRRQSHGAAASGVSGLAARRTWQTQNQMCRSVPSCATTVACTRSEITRVDPKNTTALSPPVSSFLTM